MLLYNSEDGSITSTHVSNISVNLPASNLDFYRALHFGLSESYEEIKTSILTNIKEGSNSRFLILGGPGTGKTFLVMDIIDSLNKDGREIDVYSNYFSKENTSRGSVDTKENYDRILVIDGLDEFISEDRSKLFKRVSECKQCIVTTRKFIGINESPKNNELFDTVFNLDDYDTKAVYLRSMIDVVSSVFAAATILDNRMIGISTLLSYFANNFTSKDYSENSNKKVISELSNTLEKTLQWYDGKTGEVYIVNPQIEIPKQEILTPSKEIITSFNVFQGKLVERVRKNPEIVHRMSPREFEEFIAETYETLGYEVELTKMTRDGGKDIIVYSNGPTGHNMYYVECKKYNQNNPVDVSIVRSFYGVVEADKATSGILVTSSSFTQDARNFEQQVYRKMTLVDYIDLIKMISQTKNYNSR